MAAPEEKSDKVGPEVTKGSIRQKVWDYLEENDLVNFPRPVHHRIPNFKGANEASDRAAQLEVFQKARTIKVNPDKPQEHTRFLALESRKTLLVPTPRLRKGLFNKIVPPPDSNKEELRTCATSQGVREHSEPLDLETKIHVDLIVVGSVAVSPEGFRIGKGEGYADLEFAMMKSLGVIDDSTVVVTTVHDSQVMDIPKHLFGPHDITVDYIVTPTKVIECPKQPKPPGIIWSMLDREKLQRVPILKKLRTMEKDGGKDVTLKEGPPSAPRQTRRRRVKEEGSGEEQEEQSGGEGGRDRKGGDRDKGGEGNRRRRRNPRGRRRRATKSESDDSKMTDEETNKQEEERPRRRDRQESDKGRRRERGNRAPRNPTPTVYVGSLPRALRVSEFKTKIREQEVTPLRVIWHGGSGHAFLQFEKFDAAEEAVQALKGLSINDRELKVEMSRRSAQAAGGGGGDSQEEDTKHKSQDPEGNEVKNEIPGVNDS